MTSASTPVKNQPLAGISLVSFESRQADILRQVLEKHGAAVFSAPSMQEIPFDQNPEAFAFAEKLLAGKIDVLILMTGVGTRYLMQVLEKRFKKEELVAALKKTTLVARGPKSVQALRELGLIPAMTIPEPNTWREILEELDQNPRGMDLENRTVAVQEYGEPNLEFVAALKKRQASVVQIPVYRWALPENRGPLEEAIRKIIREEFQAVVLTSAIQIRHVLKAAAEMGLENEFREKFSKLVIASIGPSTSEALQEAGFSSSFEPSHPKMGTLAKEFAEQAARIFSPPKAAAARSADSPKNISRHDSLFLRACRGEKTERTPVWLMRQAGRYQKSYRDIRGKFSFLELCKNKEAVAQVTINAVEELGVDAAIIFSDILVILEPMGFGLDYVAGDGPVISADIQGLSSIQKIPDFEPEEKLAYVMDGIHLTRANLNSEIPLIGFSGAPFTLASYLLEGGASKNFIHTKTLMYSDEKAWHALLEKISLLTAKYLQAQIRAGVDAVQIFDSWAGILNAEDYQQYVLPHSRALIEAVKGQVPVIHFGTGTAPFLDIFSSAGSDVVGIDAHISLEEGWKKAGLKKAVQGNLDPVLLFSSKEKIRAETQKILKQAHGRPGHIFNLGHGVLPGTPEENVKYLVECVREISSLSPRSTGSSR